MMASPKRLLKLSSAYLSKLLSSSSISSLALLTTLIYAISFTLTNVLAADDELIIEKVFVPEECPQKSKNGDLLSIHYNGTLADGKPFDSSYDRGQPFSFQLGVGQVIKGWDQGLLDMCVKEKRKLTVPPSLGYGDQGAGDVIPGGATLIFETELISIGKSPAAVNVFKEIDSLEADNQLSREEISEYLRKQMESMDMSQQTEEARQVMEDRDKLVEEIFQHEDHDRNGYISHEEFSGPKHDEL